MMKHLNKYISLVFIFAFILLATDAFAQVLPWRVDIRTKSGNDAAKVILGAHPTGTDVYSRGYDSDISFKAGSRIKSYFYRDDWGQSNNYFMVDIRSMNLPQTWDFFVYGANVNSNYAMGWRMKNVPDTVNLIMTDTVTGDTYDLKLQSTTTYLNISTAPRLFTVTATGYIDGWDGVAPDTIITSSIQSLAPASGLEVTYTGTDNVSDAANLTFSYSVDSGTWSSYSASTSAVLNNLSSGTHTFSVKAKDEAGNIDNTPASVSFDVDGSMPQLAVEMRIHGKAIDRGSDALRVSFKGTVSDNDALSSFTYTINDEYNEMNQTNPITVSSGESFSIRRIELIKNVNVNDSDNQRTYTVTFKATDSAGNVTEVEKIINIEKSKSRNK